MVRSIERVYGLRMKREGNPRPVIIKLFEFNEQAEVLSNCRELKRTRISSNND